MPFVIYIYRYSVRVSTGLYMYHGSILCNKSFQRTGTIIPAGTIWYDRIIAAATTVYDRTNKWQTQPNGINIFNSTKLNSNKKNIIFITR